MTLGIRKLVVIGLIGLVVLLANVMLVAHWLDEIGAIDWAQTVRADCLTGTALTVIVALLIVLVKPEKVSGGTSTWVSRCPVCDRRLVGRVNYCSECGSEPLPAKAGRMYCD